METFLNYFLLFLTYSILGWIGEVAFIYIRTGKFVDRGFLLGPYCPIYGYGAISIILYLNQYKDNFLTVLIMSMVICSVLEYFTSYLMEKLFKARWWDYSNRRFNINGRVCGGNALIFGLASLLVIYFLNPIIVNFYSSINSVALNIISIICLIIFITDTIISFKIINKLKTTVSHIEIKKDSTAEITKLVRETLKNSNKIFQHRLIKAFPEIDLSNVVKIKNDKLKNLKELLTKK